MTATPNSLGFGVLRNTRAPQPCTNCCTKAPQPNSCFRNDTSPSWQGSLTESCRHGHLRRELWSHILNASMKHGLHRKRSEAISPQIHPWGCAPSSPTPLDGPTLSTNSTSHCGPGVHISELIYPSLWGMFLFQTTRTGIAMASALTYL